MSKRHFILGIAFWLAAFTLGWAILREELSAQSSNVATLVEDVRSWVVGHKQCFTAVPDRKVVLASGDPVFLELEDGTYQQVGLVTTLEGTSARSRKPTESFEVEIYNDAVNSFDQSFQLQYHTTPMSLDWVVKTMIPPARQQEIADRLREQWQVHQRELTAELRPVIQQGVRTGLQAVEAELPQILQSHQDEFRLLGDRYETEILKAEVLPLVRNEILPIVEQEALPVAEDVGRAIWKRVSLWSFTWRFLYDKSPLPQKDAVKEEFQRFVEQEALPELRSRSSQFVDMTEAIVRRSLENPEVQQVLKTNLRRVAEDPELHRVVWNVTREAIVENETLRREFERYLKEQQTQAAVRLAGRRLEPTVRKIGEMIFGTPEAGITPEFSRVLRLQILTKDRRWLVMTPDFADSASPSVVSVTTAATPMTFPLGFDAEGQSPLTPVKPGAQ